MNRILLGFIAMIFLLAIVAAPHWQTGKGEKVGTIIKLADEGMFNTTHEMEIVRGGMNGGQGSFSMTPVCITISDDKLLVSAQKAFDEQKEIVVKYNQFLFTPFSSEGGCGDRIGEFKYATAITER